MTRQRVALITDGTANLHADGARALGAAVPPRTPEAGGTAGRSRGTVATALTGRLARRDVQEQGTREVGAMLLVRMDWGLVGTSAVGD